MKPFSICPRTTYGRGVLGHVLVTDGEGGSTTTIYKGLSNFLNKCVPKGVGGGVNLESAFPGPGCLVFKDTEQQSRLVGQSSDRMLLPLLSLFLSPRTDKCSCWVCVLPVVDLLADQSLNPRLGCCCGYNASGAD